MCHHGASNVLRLYGCDDGRTNLEWFFRADYVAGLGADGWRIAGWHGFGTHMDAVRSCVGVSVPMALETREQARLIGKTMPFFEVKVLAQAVVLVEAADEDSGL